MQFRLVSIIFWRYCIIYNDYSNQSNLLNEISNDMCNDCNALYKLSILFNKYI